MNEVEKNRDKSETAQKEEKILQFWKEQNIFQKTLEKKSPQGDFVFYEGPPTANGMPGIHHLPARAFKDIIPRYKTMRGFHVARKSGWDTHGLPVEIQVEKALGLKSKKEIEKYGVEAFNKKCKESVWKYVDVWNAFTERIGYWVDQENSYITYEKTYMESVWNILKTVSEKKVDGKDLLYKDYKVLPWCPRCGTALSSHELAQGYEDVKDLSVTVKFKVKNPAKFGLSGDVFLLAWTTTPWTLPGNVALAVGLDVPYAVVPFDGAQYILAQALVEKVFADKTYSITKKDFNGKDLLGLEYEPLYPYLTEKFAQKNPEAFAKAFKVYGADFITTEDGTGIVHTAVMYGQEDFELGTKVGLPKFHLVKEDGHFMDDMGFLSGRAVREKDVSGEGEGAKGDDTLAVDIIKDLAKRGYLFKKEKYTHSYPHCWRCKTPLIYYARDSWYIRMSSLRDTLVAENQNINWEPSHIKDGRFGQWLHEVKDWAISRERYWGTPLPIWENADGKHIVVGSVTDLKNHLPKRNNFTLIRHGESESNVNGTINCDVKAKDTLTDVGIEESKKAGEIIKDKKIDVIFVSPFLRAKQTVEQIAETIGFKGEIIEDERIGELRLGHWHGKNWEEYLKNFYNIGERFTKHPSGETSGVENWNDVRERVSQFMYDIDKRYEGKNILIVSHGGILNLITLASQGFSVKEMMKHYLDNSFMNVEVRDIDWRNLPHNDSFEIDLHKPYIDSVELLDENGAKMTRVKEVLDVWFDSGAMPFAQHHYPFETQNGAKKIPYPADYICEAVDQTRGWFYTLHAIGILLGKGRAYNNVICLGHILDAQGKKMSKSVGNVIDPWMLMDKYGVDALRLWMYTVNRPGDSKNFDEKTVDELVKKVFNLLSNVVTFYEMYADENVLAKNTSPHILDRWILARLYKMVSEGTRSLDAFQVFEAGRSIRDFAQDFSTWYIRRSRDRFKSDDFKDKMHALETTRFVLLELAKYMAPFTPFFAETLYKKVGGAKESVHLEDWLEVGMQPVGDVVMLEDMQEARALVSLGLELRNTALIKVRQPLQSFTVQSARLKDRADLLSLIEDELNVKEVLFDTNLAGGGKLDTNISRELQKEGYYREIVRAVQDLRKKGALAPKDSARLFVDTDKAGRELVEEFAKDLGIVSLIKEIVYEKVEGEKVVVGDMSFVFKIEKVS